MLTSYLYKNRYNIITLFYYIEITINGLIAIVFYKEETEFWILSVVIFCIFVWHLCHISGSFKVHYCSFIIYICIGIIKYSILSYFFFDKFYYIIPFYIVELLAHILYGNALINIFKNKKPNITLLPGVEKSLLSNINCSICLEDINDDYYITHCMHEFHGKCIISWIKQLQNDSDMQVCPYCRQNLDYVIIF